MEDVWIYIIPLVLVLGSILFARRKGPRDLHRAPAGQSAYYRWTRIAGIGLAFGCAFEVLATLFRGEWTDRFLVGWLLLAVAGFTTWFQLSEIKGPARGPLAKR